MELTLQQIQDVTFGACQVSYQDDAYYFYRFTKRQREVFYCNDPKKEQLDTTGICLDFHTDADHFCATIAQAGKYEILVDNLTVFCEHLEPEQQLCVPLSGADNRVTLILPSHTQGAIRSICLGNAAYIQPHRHKCKLAFYGDSITQGWNSEKDSQSYAWLTTRFFDAQSVNYGVGGTTFIPQIPESHGFCPEVVVVALGTNDFGKFKTMEQIKADCCDYLQAIKRCYPNSKWLCITPIWRRNGLEPRTAGTLHDVRLQIDAIARAEGFTVIDGLSLVPHRLEYYADNGTHPNDLGFAIFTSNLLKFITPYV